MATGSFVSSAQYRATFPETLACHARYNHQCSSVFWTVLYYFGLVSEAMGYIERASLW
jgi:hypothetical protein